MTSDPTGSAPLVSEENTTLNLQDTQDIALCCRLIDATVCLEATLV